VSLNYFADWVCPQIGDVADVIAGGTPSAGNPENFSAPGQDIAWLTPADLSKYDGKYISHGARDLSKLGYESSSAKLMPKGALLFSSRAPIGYVVIAANEIATNQGFKNFVFTKDVDSTYAYYFLKSIRQLAESLGTGTTFKEISGSTAKTLPFVLAPLAEQQQIAQKLDELLAQVDTLKTRLGAIPNILKRFRQSVLAAAVSGRLTEEWRGGVDAELLQNPLPKIQTYKRDWSSKNKDHNEVARVEKRLNAFNLEEDTFPLEGKGWLKSKLEDCVLMVVDCHNKTAPYVEAGIPLVRTPNIRNGKFVWSDLKFVDESTYEFWSKRCKPEAGDLVFTREAPMGEVAVIPSNIKICLGQRTMLFRPVEPFCSAKYLTLCLMDPVFRENSEKNSVGTGVKHYRVGDVSDLFIPVPSVAEQTEIVRRVEQLFAYADQIEQRVKDAQARVNHLTQSILAKAFRGELTADWRAQNPELISGENSAAALLERIKAEREVTGKKRKIKK